MKRPNPAETPLSQKIFIMRLIDRIHILHRIHMFRNTEKSGLYPGQPPVLHYIKEHPGCTQREISEFLQISTPSIANSVKRMQRAGLLEKHTDEADQRRSSLTITQEGRSRLRSCDVSMEEIDDSAFQGIPPEDLAVFCRCLEKIAENLSSEEYRNKDFFSLLAAVKELGQQQREEETI